MSAMTKAIRHKRFSVDPKYELNLLVQSKLGTVHTLVVDNCSLTGVGAISIEKLLESDGFEAGEICPSAKLHSKDLEYALGRVVVRSRRDREGKILFGFSLIDTKLPIDAALSRFLIGAEEGSNPYEVELSPEKFSVATFANSDENNVDLFARCNQFGVLLKEWEKTPQFLYYATREESMGTRVRLTQKRRGGRDDYIVMGSNDYLGLSTHPKVLEAAQAAISRYGFGSTGSPLTTGKTVLHEELCRTLSRIFQKEKTVLFNSGYAANIAAMSALARQQDFIVADFLTHASIQDGMKMSSATGRFFRHNDVNHLRKILNQNRQDYSGALIVTEGVFSMEGDIPPLNEIAAVAREFNARLYLDEAHSFGVIGDKGMGAVQLFDAYDRTDLIMGTFSKICGGIGGFISGRKDVVDWLYFFGRSQMFSVSIPPSTAAAALAALKVFQEEPQRIEALRNNIRHFVRGLREIGYKVNPNHASAVLPVVIGDEKKMGVMNQHLLDNGVFVVPVIFPAVSRNACRFRFTMTAQHSISDLDFVLNVFEAAMNKAQFKFMDQKENAGIELPVKMDYVA